MMKFAVQFSSTIDTVVDFKVVGLLPLIKPKHGSVSVGTVDFTDIDALNELGTWILLSGWSSDIMCHGY